MTLLRCGSTIVLGSVGHGSSGVRAVVVGEGSEIRVLLLLLLVWHLLSTPLILLLLLRVNLSIEVGLGGAPLPNHWWWSRPLHSILRRLLHSIHGRPASIHAFPPLLRTSDRRLLLLPCDLGRWWRLVGRRRRLGRGRRLASKGLRVRLTGHAKTIHRALVAVVSGLLEPFESLASVLVRSDAGLRGRREK